MAKASDNAFPKLIVAEGAVPANPSAGQQKLYIDSADHKLKRVDSSGAVTTVEGGGSGSGGGIIGYTAYKAASNYTTTSSTHVQIDSTNLKVTFTAPASGRVAVDMLSLLGGPGTTGQWIEWSVFESGAMITGTNRQALQGGVILSLATRHVITGLSAGSHTYTWGWKAVSCTATLYASVDAAIMAVNALP